MGERPVFDLEDHVFFLFSQIFSRRNRQLGELLRPFSVTPSRWRVLAVLQQWPGASMGRLADLTGVERTTLTRTLDGMERDGLVARHPDPEDRRAIRLFLTDAGKTAFNGILPSVSGHNEQAVKDFDAEELATFRRLLHRMVSNLDEA
ncbi:MAG TPA: MarR family transcriptional regulator [Stellaceae bacterium]|nr:MarR family transcriptional regulator [Stellaceae bacterium]